MRGCRVASSQVRDTQEGGGREWEREMDGDEKEDENSDWRNSLGIEQHKRDEVDQERDDKEGMRLRGMRRSGRESGLVT